MYLIHCTGWVIRARAGRQLALFSVPQAQPHCWVFMLLLMNCRHSIYRWKEILLLLSNGLWVLHHVGVTVSPSYMWYNTGDQPFKGLYFLYFRSILCWSKMSQLASRLVHRFLWNFDNLYAVCRSCGILVEAFHSYYSISPVDYHSYYLFSRVMK